MIGDTDLEVAKLYNMLPAEEAGTPTAAPPATNATVRSVFIIGPDKKIKLMLTYPMTTGRNFDEILRVLDSMQLTAKHKVATPVNWKQGDDVIIAGSVSDEDAKKLFPAGWKSAEALSAHRQAAELTIRARACGHSRSDRTWRAPAGVPGKACEQLQPAPRHRGARRAGLPTIRRSALSFSRAAF